MIFKTLKISPDNNIPTVFLWTAPLSARNPPTLRVFTPPEPKRCKSDEHLTKQLQAYATRLSKLQEEYTKTMYDYSHLQSTAT